MLEEIQCWKISISYNGYQWTTVDINFAYRTTAEAIVVMLQEAVKADEKAPQIEVREERCYKGMWEVTHG